MKNIVVSAALTSVQHPHPVPDAAAYIPGGLPNQRLPHGLHHGHARQAGARTAPVPGRSTAAAAQGSVCAARWAAVTRIHAGGVFTLASFV